MSRIHDALKRAEQEKTALPPAAERNVVNSDSATGSSQLPSSSGLAPSSKMHAVPPPANSSIATEFNEFVSRCTRVQWATDSSFRTPLTSEAGRVVAERFRTLRSRLYQISGTRTLKCILITSSVPAEGKTFVATNLARSLARQADRHVLLIDADLRAPRLHTALGATSAPGLSDYLREETDEYRITQNDPAFPNLCFIPCGTRVSNPSEILLSNRMKDLLSGVRPAFDWVILDSPPSLPVHDANRLADWCDGVLFVVRAGQTHHQVASKASSEFRNKNLLGVVMNEVERSEAQGDYYYGQSQTK
jgi:protein-tyrosine kinase